MERQYIAEYIGAGVMGLLWVYLLYAMLSFFLQKITNKRFGLGLRMTIVALIFVVFGTDVAGAGLGWLQWLADCFLVYLFIKWRNRDEWYYEKKVRGRSHT